jgi:hypothetical protein
MKGFEVQGKCSDNKSEECPFRKAKLAGSRHRLVESERRNLSTKGGVDRAPGHLVLPAFPLCIGRILEAGRFIPTRFFLDLPRLKKKPRRGGAFLVTAKAARLRP